MQGNLATRKVQVIPAAPRVQLMQSNITQAQILRVAAYARVSTDQLEQLTSYEAQVDYYTRLIKSKAEWEFVGVYTDKGITGTNRKKRDGFNKMIKDALDGKIDMIITKSVSRFARNTVDTLTTIRELKSHGIAVYFEEQNINTMDGKGELLITIMSSLAQEESRSISENVTWGMRKRFSDGKVSMAYKYFLGYEKGKDGLPSIVEEEAQIVRYIYRMFLEGKTGVGIAKALEDMGIPSPMGSKKWSNTTVMSILQNEKYRGSAILQKTYTVDFLEKKVKKNKGEVPQYYVEHSHEPIIDPVEFDHVQLELKRRRANRGRHSSKSVFSSRIECSDCGAYYGRKVWHSNSEYRTEAWQCNGKYKGEHRCTTPHLKEEELKARFVKAFNQIMTVREGAIEACNITIEAVCGLTQLDQKIQAATDEISVLVELSKQMIKENAQTAQNQAEYQSRHSEMITRYNAAEARLNELNRERNRRIQMRQEIEWFMEGIKGREELLTEFDCSLFVAVVEKMQVYSDRRVVVRFKNGMAIETWDE